MKSIVSRHSNDYSIKAELEPDYNMFAPSRVPIVFSIASLAIWIVTKTELKASFIQTVQTLRDLFIISPHECCDKHFYWLLLTAAYGFIIANFLITDQTQLVDKIFHSFNERFKFGTVAHAPGNIRFFGLNVVRNEYFTCMINAERKLNSIQNTISHLKRTGLLRDLLLWKTRHVCLPPLRQAGQVMQLRISVHSTSHYFNKFFRRPNFLFQQHTQVHQAYSKKIYKYLVSKTKEKSTYVFD